MSVAVGLHWSLGKIRKQTLGQYEYVSEKYNPDIQPVRFSVKIFDNSTDTWNPHLRHNSPVSVLNVWPTREQDPCLPNTIIEC
jgi:hypothetical protein